MKRMCKLFCVPPVPALFTVLLFCAGCAAPELVEPSAPHGKRWASWAQPVVELIETTRKESTAAEVKERFDRTRRLQVPIPTTLDAGKNVSEYDFNPQLRPAEPAAEPEDAP